MQRQPGKAAPTPAPARQPPEARSLGGNLPPFLRRTLADAGASASARRVFSQQASKAAPSQLRLSLLGQLTAPEKGGRGRSLVPPLQLPMEWKENCKYSFTLFQPLSAPLFPVTPSSKKPVSTSSDLPHLLIRTAQTTQSARCRSWSPELGPCFPSSMCVSLPESAPRPEQRRRPARLSPGLCPSYSQGG